MTSGPEDGAPRAQAKQAAQDDELYIGYLPKAPPRYARFVRRVVVTLVAFAVALAIVLAALQGPFDPGSFDFARESVAIGIVRAEPAPLLAPDTAASGGLPRPALLVRPFKHGAAADAALHDGQRVTLRAHRVTGPYGEMLELVPGSIVARDTGVVPPSAPERLGRFRLRGELVDSKCYLGVMKPGRGKPHRGCAARCLSGGIPPLLLVEDDSGRGVALLVDAGDGARGQARLRDHAGEQVELEGEVVRSNGVLTIAVVEAGIRLASAAAP